MPAAPSFIKSGPDIPIFTNSYAIPSLPETNRTIRRSSVTCICATIFFSISLSFFSCSFSAFRLAIISLSFILILSFSYLNVLTIPYSSPFEKEIHAHNSTNLNQNPFS